jgi:hypothetical protein
VLTGCNFGERLSGYTAVMRFSEPPRLKSTDNRKTNAEIFGQPLSIPTFKQLTKTDDALFRHHRYPVRPSGKYMGRHGGAVGDTVERVYQRSKLLERRRKMMEEWSAFCCSAT